MFFLAGQSECVSIVPVGKEVDMPNTLKHMGCHTSGPHELIEVVGRILDVSGGMEGVPPSGNFTAGGDQELDPPPHTKFQSQLHTG